MTTAPIAAPVARPPAKLVAATVIGNTIEFYDFSVYGALTAVVFAKVFFPQSDPSVATVLVLSTFAVGFLSRPLGGIIFGHLGDRIGRRPTLMVSLLVMGGATALMGVLPGYAAAGIAAPVLLVVLRFLQGFGIGGEWGGAVSLMVESAPPSRRGIYGAAVQTGSGLGLILSSLTVTVLTGVLTSRQLLSWGWRIPLLLSVVLVLVGLIIRSRIEESTAFEEVRGDDRIVRVPVATTLHRHWRTVLVAITMYLAVAAFGFTQGVFFISYLVNTVGVVRPVATGANLLAAVTYLLFTIVGGLLSDRVGRVPAYVIGGVALLPAPFLMFGVGSTGSIPALFVVMAVIGVLTGLAYGAQAALFFEMFPAKLRYTGISLGFQTAAVLGGGLTPVFAALLYDATGTTAAVSLYLTALTLVMIASSLVANRVLRRDARAETDERDVPPAVAGDAHGATA